MDPTLKASAEALDFFFSSHQMLFDGKRILINQGYPDKYLNAFKNCQIDVISYHADHVDLWKNKGITANSLHQQNYDLVIQFVAKSDSETKVELSQSLDNLSPDGQFIGVVHNRMGATRYKKDLQNIFSNTETISKAKCRVLSSKAEDIIAKPDFSELNKPSKIGNSEYLTIPGVYGEKSIDKGSILLAEILKQEYWSGFGADIGCGFGYLSGELLKTHHKIKKMWLYDVDSRAIAMAKLNLANKVEAEFSWADITKSISCERPLHWAIMNPPFHSGTAQDFELGQTFIKQAASLLRQGSPLFMVANLHLPYEETLYENFRSVVKLTEKDGFKCFKAIK